MDGDYAEQLEFVDHELDAINGEEEEEEEEEEQQQQQGRRHGIEIESFDNNVDGSAGIEIKGSVDLDPPPRDLSAGKLFVGGISWETTEETFSNYFSKYGEITDSVIMLDKQSGRPRGFGFVTFVDSAVVDKVLEKEHVIDGRAVEVKRTVPREDMQVKGILKTKKIFVGGIPPSFSEDEMKEYFSTYGDILEHQIMLDHQTGRSRGFGFVTFESEDAVEMIFSEGKTHELGGKQVEIKKAEPKRAFADNNGSARSYGGSRGSVAGYGGGYGSGGGYGGKKERGYGEYGAYSGHGGYGNYGDNYGGGSAGFYGGYGGYGYGFGFGGPMYGNAGYGGSGYGGYGTPGGYAAATGYGGGKGYGSGGGGYGTGGGGYGTGGGGGYSSGGRGRSDQSSGGGRGYGNGGARGRGGYSNGRGYGSAGAGADGAATDAGRYHPYQR